MKVEIKPDDETVTKQTFYNAWLWWKNVNRKDVTYADWISSEDKEIEAFRRGWKMAWDSANKEKK